ncbi:MAG: hypothetical protein CMH81_06895 [Nitrospiraceae bacterium]|nr:hypothetical protein [Nitrospiraceae bacterium]
MDNKSEVSTMTRLVLILMMMGIGTNALAADDPSIKGEKRSSIQAAMSTHIAENSVDGRYVLYDPIDDKVLKLKLDDLHDGIVQKSDFYVSCADFSASDGTYYDLDFMVVENDGEYKALQGFVHKVGDTKRKYHLENTVDTTTVASVQETAKATETSDTFTLFGFDLSWLKFW